MGNYKAIYKCRLCGELYDLGKQMEVLANSIENGLNRYEKTGVWPFLCKRQSIHVCLDYSIGFGDLQGFKKISKKGENT